MSAPRTNIEAQKRRHVAPLVGMLAVVVFAVGLILWWLTDESAEAPGPTDDATAVEPTAAAPGTPDPTTTVDPAPSDPAVGQQQPPGGSN
ncbi:hypothetical protein [Frigidibacter sp. MR17.24]|uniref:hypothetical protein n=1 Tax=Frigidibacter sp. MR17.24 TaxID=3127345 RepID=UPI003012E402